MSLLITCLDSPKALPIMQIGSQGKCALARLPYFVRRFHSPFATYHILYLGIAKNFMNFLVRHVSVQKGGIARTVKKLPCKTPLIARAVMAARLVHARLRSSPSCRAVNFFEHVGAMTIEECQLWLEVLSPYLMHDMLTFGLHPDILNMWCEIR